jgi:hypothetical protein
MVVDADLGTAQAGEILLSLIGAGTIRLCAIMMSALALR